MARDPRTKFPKPGRSEKKQEYPGIEDKMVTKPVYDTAAYKGNSRLKDKVALVTGGDSGIGRAVAVAYAKEGAHVAIAYLPEEEIDAKRTALEIEKQKREVMLLPGDLRDDDYCESLIQAVVDEFGAIDVLVNNAALQKVFKTFDEITARHAPK